MAWVVVRMVSSGSSREPISIRDPLKVPGSTPPLNDLFAGTAASGMLTAGLVLLVVIRYPPRKS